MRTSPRCLLCGSQLAFLTKLTSAFCSDQHRDEYHARVDSVVLKRLKAERRRLIQRGSIAPAPLARLLRRGPQSISVPGITKASAEPLPPAGYVAVPGRAVPVSATVACAGYLDVLSGRRNPGIIKIDCESRGMQRRWPKAPRLAACITRRAGLLEARTTAVDAVAPPAVTVDVHPVAFTRAWNITRQRTSPIRAVRSAERSLQVVAPREPAQLQRKLDTVVFERPAAIPTSPASRPAFHIAARGLIAPRVHAKAPENLGTAHVPEIFERAARFPQTTLRLDTGLMHAVWSRSTVRPAAGSMPFEEVAAMPFARTAQVSGSRFAQLTLHHSGLLRVPVAIPATPIAPLGQTRSCDFLAAVSHASVQAQSALCTIRPALHLVRTGRAVIPHVPDGFKGLIVGGRPDAFPRTAPLPIAIRPADARGIAASTSLLQVAAPSPAAKRIEIVVDPIGEPFPAVAALPRPWLIASRSGIELLPLSGPCEVASKRVRAPHIGMVAMRLRPLMPASRLTTTGIRPARSAPAIPLWQRVPSSWKRMSLGIPLAAVAFAVYLTMDRSNMSQVRAESSVLQHVMGDMRRDLNARAAIDLTDTFASGLNQWSGAEKWNTSWTADTTGAVPGKLALLTASIPMRDYSADFTGQITKKALSFVLRARDLDNYYAVRFVVVTPGLLPEVVMERYSVVAGEESERVRTPIHMPLAHDSLYRVRVELKDQNFTVYLNDQVADSWSDARFPTGGIGFFSKKSERARITGLRVWHQDDTVGRLLAHISRDDDKKAR